MIRRPPWSLVHWSRSDSETAVLKARDDRRLRILYAGTDGDKHLFRVELFDSPVSVPVVSTWSVASRPQFGASQTFNPSHGAVQCAIESVPPLLLEEAAAKAIARGVVE